MTSATLNKLATIEGAIQHLNGAGVNISLEEIMEIARIHLVKEPSLTHLEIPLGERNWMGLASGMRSAIQPQCLELARLARNDPGNQKKINDMGWRILLLQRFIVTVASIRDAEYEMGN